MVSYDLDHLTQPENQYVGGPVQDDEALFLYAVVRGMRLRRILEVGGLDGYSARNFLRAVGGGGVVYTVDINPVRQVAPNHRVITKDAAAVRPGDVDGAPLDLVFFDAHAYAPQMDMFLALQRAGIIHERTVLALHDTNLHPTQLAPWAYPVEGGWVHQETERRMVNDFRRMGYDAFSLHPDIDRHDDALPFRHGITVMRRFSPLTL